MLHKWTQQYGKIYGYTHIFILNEHLTPILIRIIKKNISRPFAYNGDKRYRLNSRDFHQAIHEFLTTNC